jgi:hypothetical protein
MRIAKPNNGQFRNRAPKVSISIKLAAFQARGAARVKLHYLLQKSSFFLIILAAF